MIGSSYKNEEILLCYLRKDKDVDALADKVNGEEGITVYVYNKPAK